MAGGLANWTAGLRRRFAELNPREQRALALLGVFVVVFGVGLTVFLVHSSLSRRAARNAENAAVLSQVREKGRDYKNRLAEQAELNARLGKEMPPLPSILGEVLATMGQERQDFQELQPEPIGPAGAKRKPWIRQAVKFPLRKVSATTVYEFLLQLREKYPDLPLAVTSMDMRLDRTEENLYNVEMVVSAYRLAEPRPAEGGAGGAGETGSGAPAAPAGRAKTPADKRGAGGAP